MFQIWLENDTDPTPENLLYTLEGLQLLDLTKDIFWTIGFLFLHKKEIKKKWHRQMLISSMFSWYENIAKISQRGTFSVFDWFHQLSYKLDVLIDSTSHFCLLMVSFICTYLGRIISWDWSKANRVSPWNEIVLEERRLAACILKNDDMDHLFGN